MRYKLQNIWDFIRWDIRRFFFFFWRFRKELKDFGGWDHHYVMQMLNRSLTVMRDSFEKDSNEYESMKIKKLEHMNRALYLMDCILNDKFHDMAEERLGYEMIYTPFEFEPEINKDGKKVYKMITKEESEGDKEKNMKLFYESSKIEREVWSEFFDILKGDVYFHDQVSREEFKDKAYEDVHDGKGLINWWY